MIKIIQTTRDRPCHPFPIQKSKRLSKKMSENLTKKVKTIHPAEYNTCTCRNPSQFPVHLTTFDW